MQRLLVAAMTISIVLTARSALAQERRWDFGASLGYGAPAGSAERGARTSDSTFGLVPLAADASYRFSPIVGASVSGVYAFGIPTLCATAGDCVSSLGHDIRLVASARFFLPRLGSLEPHADVGFGWEWLTSKLSDSGATSSRSYDGPVLIQIDAAAPFALGKRVTLGPVASAMLGTFVRARLETDASAESRSVQDHAFHAWLSLSLRASVRF